jgi:hypothetical protein
MRPINIFFQFLRSIQTSVNFFPSHRTKFPNRVVENHRQQKQFAFVAKMKKMSTTGTNETQIRPPIHTLIRDRDSRPKFKAELRYQDLAERLRLRILGKAPEFLNIRSSSKEV